MKQYLLYVLLGVGVCVSASAQAPKTKKRPGNRFDTTLAKKHELIISPGVVGNPIYDYRTGGRGASLNIEYARVYKYNHFLRTGLRFASDTRSGQRELYLPAAFENGPSNSGPLPPAPGFSEQYSVRNTEDNAFAGLFVGYEYGVGVRRFRFTFGADLHVGYNNRRVYQQEHWYAINTTYDMGSPYIHYDVQGTRSGEVTGRGHYVFMAISPRLGIRRDLGRRIALALTFTPQVGYTQRLGYSETVMGDRPVYFYHPKSLWFASANAELRLIIKLGKS